MSTSPLSPDRAPRLLQPEAPATSPRHSPFSELIGTLFSREADTSCRPILFTSLSPGSGVSFACSYIATELAACGHKVLLADAQAILKLASRPAEEAHKQPERIDLSRLWVLGHRQVGPSLAEDRTAVSSASSVLAVLRAEFTQIVIDAPALSASSEALALSSAVYGTVLVVARDSVAKGEMERTQRHIVSLGGRVLGSIYNDSLGGQL